MVYLVVLAGALVAAVILYSIFNKKWDVPQETENVVQDVLPEKEVVEAPIAQELVVPIYESSSDLAPESTVTVQEASLAPTPVPQESKKTDVKKKPTVKKASTTKKQK